MVYRWLFRSLVGMSVLLVAWTVDESSFGASDTKPQDTRAFLYDFAIDFLFLDELAGLNRPTKSSSSYTRMNMSGDVAQQPTATLGLRSAKFGLEWRISRKLAIELALRPDAVNGEDYREVDTRAGRVIEQAPSVRVLDQYRLIYRALSSTLRLGVEREVLESYRVINDTLDFGLRVRGPEKSMLAGFEIPKLVDFNQGKNGHGIGIAAAALSGRDERHNYRSQQDSGRGESPAKKDPYWGGAAGATWVMEGDTRLGLSAATMEERSAGIKVRSNWYHLGLRRHTTMSDGGRWLVAMEARQLLQVFAREGTYISDVSLSSVGLTSRYERRSGEGPLFALWIGAGELHPEGTLTESKPARGTQFNLGWQWLMEESLYVSAMVSREWRRDGQLGGHQSGGFARGSSMRSALSRFAIGVSYLTGGQL